MLQKWQPNWETMKCTGRNSLFCLGLVEGRSFREVISELVLGGQMLQAWGRYEGRGSQAERTAWLRHRSTNVSGIVWKEWVTAGVNTGHWAGGMAGRREPAWLWRSCKSVWWHWGSFRKFLARLKPIRLRRICEDEQQCRELIGCEKLKADRSVRRPLPLDEWSGKFLH